MSEIIAEKTPLLDILGKDALIKVPRYQRSYSWEKDNLNEFWEDLLTYVFDENREHFIGALIFCDAQNGHHSIPVFELVDGQQRLTTISILLRAMHDLIKDINVPLATTIINDYICGGAYDERIYNKLQLGEVDEDFFRDNIQTRTGESLGRGKKKSHKRIIAAYEFFSENLIIASSSREKDIGKFIEELFRKMKQKIVSIRIKVSSEVEAYTIFETINARGVDLTVSDLLKNYIFSSAGENVEGLQTEWHTMQDAMLDRNLEVAQYIRHYWISFYGEVREKKLYQVIKKEFNTDRIRLRKFCESLKNETENYIKIFDYQDEKDGAARSIRSSLQVIRKLKMRQCYPLLFSAFSTGVNDDQLSKLLRLIVDVSIRRSVTDKNPNELESFYYRSAKELREGGESILGSLMGELAEYRVDERDFERAFIEGEMSNVLAKIILEAWEDDGSKNEKRIYKATLEHVMPQVLGNGWSHITSDMHKNYVSRIGNLTLVGKSYNSAMSNRSFGEKIGILNSSEIRITKKISEDYSTWGPDEIDARSNSALAFIKRWLSIS